MKRTTSAVLAGIAAALFAGLGVGPGPEPHRHWAGPLAGDAGRTLPRLCLLRERSPARDKRLHRGRVLHRRHGQPLQHTDWRPAASFPATTPIRRASWFVAPPTAPSSMAWCWWSGSMSPTDSTPRISGFSPGSTYCARVTRGSGYRLSSGVDRLKSWSPVRYGAST